MVWAARAGPPGEPAVPRRASWGRGGQRRGLGVVEAGAALPEAVDGEEEEERAAAVAHRPLRDAAI